MFLQLQLDPSLTSVACLYKHNFQNEILSRGFDVLPLHTGLNFHLIHLQIKTFNIRRGKKKSDDYSIYASGLTL